MHRGAGPCTRHRGHKVKRQSWAGATPGGWSGKGLGVPIPTHTLRNTHPNPSEKQALLWGKVPPKSGCWRADFTVLGSGTAVARIILGNRNRLPTYFPVDLELLGQCVDHYRQVLLPNLGQGKRHTFTQPQAPRLPPCHSTCPNPPG